jgi:hypothetical protein
MIVTASAGVAVAAAVLTGPDLDAAARELDGLPHVIRAAVYRTPWHLNIQQCQPHSRVNIVIIHLLVEPGEDLEEIATLAALRVLDRADQADAEHVVVDARRAGWDGILFLAYPETLVRQRTAAEWRGLRTETVSEDGRTTTTTTTLRFGGVGAAQVTTTVR